MTIPFGFGRNFGNEKILEFFFGKVAKNYSSFTLNPFYSIKSQHRIFFLPLLPPYFMPSFGKNPWSGLRDQLRYRRTYGLTDKGEIIEPVASLVQQV